MWNPHCDPFSVHWSRYAAGNLSPTMQLVGCIYPLCSAAFRQNTVTFTAPWHQNNSTSHPADPTRQTPTPETTQQFYMKILSIILSFHCNLQYYNLFTLILQWFEWIETCVYLMMIIYLRSKHVAHRRHQRPGSEMQRCSGATWTVEDLCENDGDLMKNLYLSISVSKRACLSKTGIS
jgi:hypothetical protein